MGTLYIVSTPIGNLEDITIRAIQILYSVDVIACEDTRRTGVLLSELKKRYSVMFRNMATNYPLLISYHDRIEQAKTPEIVEYLLAGKTVALVSDAGTPLLSDPGFLLVRECKKRNIPVISIPGASALLTALPASGLPVDKFMFLGFPPEKQAQRLKLFRNLTLINRLIGITYVLYCAPHKLTEVLTDMRQEFGDIELVICRELTKIHEEHWKGNIQKALDYFLESKGEMVILFRLYDFR